MSKPVLRSLFRCHKVLVRWRSNSVQPLETFTLYVQVKLRRDQPSKILSVCEVKDRLINVVATLGSLPVNGKANTDLEKLLSTVRIFVIHDGASLLTLHHFKTCKVPLSSVRIISGLKSKHKIVRLYAPRLPFETFRSGEET